jgi:hypothetical protein
MKQICSARLLIGSAVLFLSSASGLLAQTEMASNAMPHTLPLISASSPADKGIVGDSFKVSSAALIGAPLPNTDRLTPLAPGTIANVPASPLKPSHKSGFSVEPDYLPSWVTNQPLAYLRYGAAPAVATLHFGHK